MSQSQNPSGGFPKKSATDLDRDNLRPQSGGIPESQEEPAESKEQQAPLEEVMRSISEETNRQKNITFDKVVIHNQDTLELIGEETQGFIQAGQLKLHDSMVSKRVTENPKVSPPTPSEIRRFAGLTVLLSTGLLFVGIWGVAAGTIPTLVGAIGSLVLAVIAITASVLGYTLSNE
jgi:hypothetical protein